MSEIAIYERSIQESRDQFLRSATGLNFETESIFATQALMKTEFSISIARSNPNSVRLAMLNLASTGLTLNPANAYAYLVPRDRAIVLDISYKGLIKIACDTGSIQWARAAAVFASDSFEYLGPATAPVHKANPFSGERGDLIGVYCIAKTAEGDTLTEVLPMEELEKIRGKSDLYAKKKSGPWVEWFEQMAKKAVIKRASKTWPYTEKSDRVAQAIELANQAEGGYSFETDEEKEHKRKQLHDAALGRNYKNVEAIKAAIKEWDESEDSAHLYTCLECWTEISREDKIDLWLAPTKGGVFTTHERDVLKLKMPRDTSTEETAKGAA